MMDEWDAAPVFGTDYLVFALSGYTFGVPYTLVRELRRFDERALGAPVSDATGDVLGTATVAGVPVPVIDLSRRLGLGPHARQAEMVFVADRALVHGLVVDAGLDTLAVDDGDRGEVPDGQPLPVARTLLSGLAHVGRREVWLFDWTAVLAH